MIKAIKHLNRGRTQAVATLKADSWSVKLLGKCHPGNRRTVEEGWEQILNQQLRHSGTVEGSLDGTGFELQPEETPK